MINALALKIKKRQTTIAVEWCVNITLARRMTGYETFPVRYALRIRVVEHRTWLLWIPDVTSLPRIKTSLDVTGSLSCDGHVAS
jgi:hypothetical protein